MSASLTPAASMSSTSLTRIRIPRMHGRPPHWLGLMVIRSSSFIGLAQSKPFECLIGILRQRTAEGAIRVKGHEFDDGWGWGQVGLGSHLRFSVVRALLFVTD